jgi:heavy metal translocating P-type ATPase
MSIFDIVCIVVGILGAAYSLYGLVKSLKEKDFGLDVLALMAIVSTLIVGEYIASAVVVAMTLTGDFLESYTEKRATKELGMLMERNPHTAHLIIGDAELGETDNRKDVTVDEVKVDDILYVLPGEIVPVNGILLDNGEFDESQITGESIPVTRAIGEEVYSGVVLNGSPVRLKAFALAKDSQYQKIVDLVKDAQDEKSPTVRLASKISIPFTIVSLLIGIFAWIISGDVIRFVEVLVLATPCPLLIAAPVAFLGGMSRAASKGIIIKSGGVLEQLSRVKVVAFDKTGTVTVGSPAFDRVEVFNNEQITEQEVLALGAALESNSSHILGASIVDEAANQRLELPKVTEPVEVVGKGVEAKLEGKIVRVGSEKFVRFGPGIGLSTGAGIGPSAGTSEIKSLGNSEMGVYISVSGELIGRIILKDHLRPEAISTMKDLRKIGVQHLTMVTGDERNTAVHIGEQLGVKDIRSEMLPQQKLEAVLGLKYSCEIAGHSHTTGTVLMVGDGVNDAPVLAAADIGVAMAARGTTVASQSADAVITHDDISLVAKAITIAKDTVAIGKQSMIGGIGLSIMLMLIATTGVIPAIGGAALQEVIDILAICNGVRAAFK